MREMARLYFDTTSDPTMDKNALPVIADMLTDSWFTMPAILTAQNLAKNARSNVYLYYYAYPGSANMCDLINLEMPKLSLKMTYRALGFGAQGLGLDLFVRNVSCHGDETLLLFKPYDIPINFHYSETDQKIAGTLLHLWTNFVKNGNPSDDWPRFDPYKNPQRLEFKSNAQVEMKPLIHDKFIEIWMELYRKDPPRLKRFQHQYSQKISIDF